MNLLFFGRTGRQLFGAYHAPTPGVAVRGAAVLCPPWGPEYLVTHRILRRLAMRLNESGYHVLRFDYYGTGDSAGEREDGDLSSWYDDATLAVDELRDMSGCATVASFGIRLGAVIAWRLAAMRADVHATVLWDPVVRGEGYLRELVAAQLESDRWSLSRKRWRPSPDRAIDLLGFPLTPSMRQSIEGVSPAEFRRPTQAQVKLFYSDTLPVHEELHAALRSGKSSFDVETLPGQTPWRADETIGSGGLPFLVLRRMVESLQ